jgi:hypothetical protein
MQCLQLCQMSINIVKFDPHYIILFNKITISNVSWFTDILRISFLCFLHMVVAMANIFMLLPYLFSILYAKTSKHYVIWNGFHSLTKDSRCNCQCMLAIAFLHVQISFRLLPFLHNFITPLMLRTECWEGCTNVLQAAGLYVPCKFSISMDTADVHFKH